MDPMMSKVILITWAGMGVKIENLNETIESLYIEISVPETSFELDVHGNEMSGKLLIKRFKTKMTKMGVKRLNLTGKIRYGDHWSREKRQSAEIDMKKSLFGSQW